MVQISIGFGTRRTGEIGPPVRCLTLPTMAA
jgi:hypothetical protein